MSEHFICDEMLDAGEKQLQQAADRGTDKRMTALQVFLVMREIERMALAGGPSETVH